MLHLFVRLKGQNVGHKLNRVAMVCQQCDVTVTNTVTYLELKYSIRFCFAEFLQKHESLCRDTDASLRSRSLLLTFQCHVTGPIRTNDSALYSMREDVSVMRITSKKNTDNAACVTGSALFLPGCRIH